MWSGARRRIHEDGYALDEANPEKCAVLTLAGPRWQDTTLQSAQAIASADHIQFDAREGDPHTRESMAQVPGASTGAQRRSGATSHGGGLRT